MTLAEVHDDRSLQRFMTEPSPALTEAAPRIEGPVLVLGGSGKMGPELAATLRRADRAAGVERDLVVASTFSDDATRAGAGGGRHPLHPRRPDRPRLPGTRCPSPGRSSTCSASSSAAAPTGGARSPSTRSSPTSWANGSPTRTSSCSRRPIRTPGVGYVPGAPGAWAGPAGGERGAHAIGPPLAGGSREDAEVQPHGVYGWSIVAREASFATTAARHVGQRICNYRLSYAQHLCYGVLRDLADMVHRGAPVSLAVPAVNLISQRDAVDVALRCLEHCANPPWTVNVSGPGHRVAGVVSALGGRARARAGAGRRRGRHGAADRRHPLPDDVRRAARRRRRADRRGGGLGRARRRELGQADAVRQRRSSLLTAAHTRMPSHPHTQHRARERDREMLAGAA